jgi:hypothetical protein
MQLLERFLLFYGNRSFITAFTRVLHLYICRHVFKKIIWNLRAPKFEEFFYFQTLLIYEAGA